MLHARLRALLPRRSSRHTLLRRRQAIGKINPSVAQKDVARHEEWLQVYGSI